MKGKLILDWNFVLDGKCFTFLVGRFKYVLIKVYAKELEDGSEPSKLVVRGNVDAQWHGNDDSNCCRAKIFSVNQSG